MISDTLAPVLPPDRIDVFVSCSPADEPLLRDLEKHLAILQRRSAIRAWNRGRVEAGREHEAEAAARLEAAQVILLLVSANYLADETSWGEVKRALERQREGGARVIPILLRACDWRRAPFGALSPLPANGEPITKWSDHDEAWADVTRGLWSVVEKLTDPAAGDAQASRERDPEAATKASWHLVHPYPMQPHFTGRAAERAILRDWLHGEPERPLLLIRALGGFGKSALAWRWLLEDVEPSLFPRVVWWSFYEAESGFDSFLRGSLPYLGGDAGAPGKRGQADALVRALRQPGTLLVLDGFERELRAFGGADAPYLADGTAAEDDRDCITPAAERVLRALASLPEIRGKVLITTRLRPRILEGPGCELLAGCRELALGEMLPEDAVAFFKAQDIRGSEAEIRRVCERYGCHPLSLRLLAGLVVGDPEHPFDIEASRKLDVRGDLRGRKHHVLEQAFRALSPGCRALLSGIACFRGPVSYASLTALTTEEAGDGGGLDGALRELLRRGLLQHDRRASRYDLHPIVRHYAYDRLTEPERKAAHDRLCDYFALSPEPARISTLNELTPVIELYHHMVRAARYDDAWAIYEHHIRTPLYYTLGEYDTDISLLESIPRRPDGAPDLSHAFSRVWSLRFTAMSYEVTGRPRRGLELAEHAVRSADNAMDRACSLVSSSKMRCDLGQLRRASGEIAEASELFDRIEHPTWQGICRRSLGRILMIRGDYEGALQELDRAVAAYGSSLRHYKKGTALILLYRAQLYLRKGDPQSALESAQVACEAHFQATDKRVGVRAEWLLGAAHRALGDLDAAEDHLAEALTRCRAVSSVEHEAPILLEIARLRMDTGEREEALRLTEAALSTAERCGYALQAADAHLVLARVARSGRDTPAALAHLRRARALASCDGPPDFTYKVAYDEAGARIRELGDAS